MVMFLPMKQILLAVSSVCVEELNAKPQNTDSTGFTSGKLV